VGCAAIRAGWTDDADQRADVLFLQKDVDKPGLLDAIEAHADRAVSAAELRDLMEAVERERRGGVRPGVP
jgi:hypothetical protein